MPTEQQILSEEAVREIEARANAALSGPWVVTDGQHIDRHAHHPDGDRLLSEGSYDANYHEFGSADVEFIAHAREDVPALCQTVRALQGQYDSAVSDFAVEINRVNQQLSEVEKERERLLGLIDTPHTDSWLRAVPLEAAHQIKRWGVEHDVGKTPWDWFWLIGYLAQKAAGSALAGDTEKAKHHTISTGAVLLNWFRRLAGDETMFQPGIDPTQRGAAATLSDAAQRLPQEMIHKLENLDHQGD